jgi:peptidyl-prolyl cis-trans isomerase SurA
MSALFLRILLAAVIALFPSLASAQGLRVVARVNDDAITDFDLSQRVLFAIRTTGLQDSPELRQRMAAQILRQMIDERLQIQDAKRLGLKTTDGELQQRFADIERGAGMARGQFKQYLQSVGVPYEIAVQQIEAQIAWARSCAGASVPRSMFPKPRSTTP